MQTALANAELSMATCDDFLLTSTVWRYKICKFQAVTMLKNKIEEFKLKAAALASSTTTAPATFHETNSVSNTQSA